MAKINYEDRQTLRRTLKWSLRTETGRTMNSNGLTKEWYDKKLDGILAYGLVKERIPKRIQKILRLHFDQGIPMDKVAFEMRLSIRQVIREMNKGLDLIIDNVPRGLFASLCPSTYRWLLKGCPHCQGDLFWDAEGAHGQE